MAKRHIRKRRITGNGKQKGWCARRTAPLSLIAVPVIFKKAFDSFFMSAFNPLLTIDSNLTLEEALAGTQAPPEIKRQQVLLDIEHWSFDGALHRGQLLVHEAVADEVASIFEIVKTARFPIEKIIPVVAYHWSDDVSMEENNTSGFNYRAIVGASALSRHATGRAVDINPRLNPYIKGDLVLPPGAVYDPQQPGTLTADSVVVQAFTECGWTWGGHWETRKDWHHFEKA